MLSLSDGDVKGCWMVVSGKAALFSAPVVLLALISHLATGTWAGHTAAHTVKHMLDPSMRGQHLTTASTGDIWPTLKAASSWIVTVKLCSCVRIGLHS